MNENLDKAWELTKLVEGGTTVDSGGLTTGGVTQAIYSKWRRTHSQPDQPVTKSTEAERKAIFTEWYWMPCGAPQAPFPWDIILGDEAFNVGAERMAKLAQKACGVRQDGEIGPITVRWMGLTDWIECLDECARYYQTLNQASTYLAGWFRRLLVISREVGKLSA